MDKAAWIRRRGNSGVDKAAWIQRSGYSTWLFEAISTRFQAASPKPIQPSRFAQAALPKPLLRITLAMAFALAAPVQAHHGWSEYDTTKVMNLTGVIKESGYEHPHGHILLDASGKVWHVVLAPPSRMENRGLAKETLKPGATVTVVAYPNRNKLDELRAERLTANGRTVELR